MKTLKNIIQVIILILFTGGVVYAMRTINNPKISYLSIVGLFLVIFVGQILHECLHSVASKIILGDWGEVYFGIRKGFFYTSKTMTVKQFVIILLTPFILMESFFIFLLCLNGRIVLYTVDGYILVLAVLVACVSDIANAITYLVYRNKITEIKIAKPYNVKIKLKNEAQIL